MTDREKVIKGIECCLTLDSSCGECPYYSYEDIQELDCERNLRHDALALLKEHGEQIKNRDKSLEKAREEIKWLREMLKEQKAVKPIIYKEDDWMSAFCGNCNGFLYHGLPFMDTEEYPDKPDYCPNCGKKVKWN